VRHVRHLRPFAKLDVHLPGVRFAPVEMIFVEEAQHRDGRGETACFGAFGCFRNFVPPFP
jgi:hypothetical protein